MYTYSSILAFHIAVDVSNTCTYSRQQQQYIIEHPPLIADVASLAPLYIQCVLRSSWLGSSIYPSSFPFLGGDGMAERERK